MIFNSARSAAAGDLLITLLGEPTDWAQSGLDAEIIDTAKKAFAQKRDLLLLPGKSNRLLVWFGGKDNSDSDREALRRLGADAAELINRHCFSSAFVLNHSGSSSKAWDFLEGVALANYQFRKYRNSDEGLNTLNTLRIPASTLNAAELKELEIVVSATYKARDLVNEPLSTLTAVQMSKEFQTMGREAGFSVSVLNKKKIQELGMGGILAVNLGSPDPPTFTIMEWKGGRPRNKKPLVLVGKGVVYDTGGLSLKHTAKGMDFMKCDMAGGAAVAAAMYAIAMAKVPVHVIALVPASDNRPGGNAYVPGDVIKMMSGKTVEVLNTDAEGRMLLADALHYAKRYKPELVIDLATLTGASAMAIGPLGMVAMGTADEQVMKNLKQSGQAVHERLAEYPFWPEYGEEIKSEIADIKNVGNGFGGSITAGKFLEHFTEYPWIHLDIAGPAFLHTPNAYRTRFGSGIGTRLLYHFVKNYAQ